MSSDFDQRLADRGLSLPDTPVPVANYVPYVQVANTLYVSGQISMDAQGLITGKIGAELTAADGAKAAQACALALLAQARAACGGDISRLKRVVKLTGFVNSTPDFSDQPKVVNGASDLMVELLGDIGRHARSALSAGALPFNVAVEVEGIFEIE